MAPTVPFPLSFLLLLLETAATFNYFYCRLIKSIIIIMAARHCLGTHTHTLTDTQFVVTFCQAVLLLLLTALSTDDCIV